MQFLKSKFKVIAGSAVCVVALMAGAVACDEGASTSTDRESAVSQSNYDKLTAAQPAHEMKYSPTRDTINFWVDTWGAPGKLSYVYLQNGDGKLIGYYILKGLPVSYCSALTPNYIERWGSNSAFVVPAPGLDGTYEASGAACTTYYGQDVNGNYIEYTVGLGINVLLYDQPLPQTGSVPALSPPKK